MYLLKKIYFPSFYRYQNSIPSHNAQKYTAHLPVYNPFPSFTSSTLNIFIQNFKIFHSLCITLLPLNSIFFLSIFLFKPILHRHLPPSSSKSQFYWVNIHSTSSQHILSWFLPLTKVLSVFKTLCIVTISRFT